MRYFSTFSGIGGFELAIEYAYEALRDADRSEERRSQEGTKGDKGQRLLAPTGEDIGTEKRSVSERATDLSHERPLCVGYSEIDKYAIATYQKHFPSHKNYGDITKIDADALPDFDLLVGGFPCQTFSIAGKRAGFEDTRGTMFFELARILRAKQPRLFVFENVKGLLSHDNGRTFKTIIATLDELGYDVQWQVLNSKNHGVPQNRERVFIVGHLRGTTRPQVFPFGESNETPIREDQDIAGALTANYWKGPETYGGRTFIHQLNQPTHSNDRVYGAEGVSPTLNTMQGGNRQPFVATGKIEFVGSLNPVTRRWTEHQPHLSRAHKQPARVHDACGINPALSSGETQGRYHTLTSDMRIRRLTPIECERLQGFPDNWTAGVSDTQRYKQCGNAVTVNTVRDIMLRVI